MLSGQVLGFCLGSRCACLDQQNGALSQVLKIKCSPPDHRAHENSACKISFYCYSHLFGVITVEDFIANKQLWATRRVAFKLSIELHGSWSIISCQEWQFLLTVWFSWVLHCCVLFISMSWTYSVVFWLGKQNNFVKSANQIIKYCETGPKYCILSN